MRCENLRNILVFVNVCQLNDVGYVDGCQATRWRTYFPNLHVTKCVHRYHFLLEPLNIGDLVFHSAISSANIYVFRLFIFNINYSSVKYIGKGRYSIYFINNMSLFHLFEKTFLKNLGFSKLNKLNIV